MCPCGKAAQNTAYIMSCERVVGGEKRSAEDMEFCRAGFKLLWDNTEGSGGGNMGISSISAYQKMISRELRIYYLLYVPKYRKT